MKIVIKKSQPLINIVESEKKIEISAPFTKLQPILQEKEVTPTKEPQEILPNEEYNGLSKVNVNKIPDEYIIPTGEKSFTNNGSYDVKDISTIHIDVQSKLGTKNITENGIYKSTDDGLDGYNEITVNTKTFDVTDYFYLAPKSSVTDHLLNRLVKKIPEDLDMSKVSDASYAFFYFGGEEIPELDYSRVTNAISIFEGCSSLRKITNFNATKLTGSFSRAFYNCLNLLEIPKGFDVSNVTNLTNAFYNCTLIDKLPAINTYNVVNFGGLFSNCKYLKFIPELNGSSATVITNMFNECISLSDFGGFLNLGMSYRKTVAANSATYKLNLMDSTKLTHDSLMNIINKLYDIKTLGCRAQALVIGPSNLTKLTEEEIAIATSKGWNVS